MVRVKDRTQRLLLAQSFSQLVSPSVRNRIKVFGTKGEEATGGNRPATTNWIDIYFDMVAGCL